MSNWQLTLFVLLYGFTAWLGFYLLERGWRRWWMRLAGLALLAYATALALAVLNSYVPATQTAVQMLRLIPLFILLATLFLLGTVVAIAPGFAVWNQRLEQQKRPFTLIWLGLIIYSLGLALLILLPADSGWRAGTIVGAGVALMLVGLGAAIIYAQDAGQVWYPHMIRSLDYAFFTAVLFGGQIVLAMAFYFGVTFPTLLLLLGVITAAVLVIVFAGPVQTAVDRIAFSHLPQIRHARFELRAESDAAQLVNPALDLLAMDEATFSQHTRRALSQLGNLPRLAANPLIFLPLVETRLQADGREDHTLSRAAELKAILTESIARLKPPGEAAFGTTAAWRHYNALYFPYVMGLRPYTHRHISGENGDTAADQAADWFRSQVPQRTLYNWQNDAARLIARDLRERSRQKN